MSKKSSAKNAATLITIAIVMIVVFVGAIFFIDKDGKTNSQISREAASARLEKKLKKIEILTGTPRKAAVEIADSNLADELPDIEKYPLSVSGGGTLDLEIFSSTEKSSKGTDGWLNEIAEEFNRTQYDVNGQWGTISVRPIASGAAVDYIVSGKHVPPVYSPSNTIWGDIIKSQNVDINLVCDRIAGNTAGVLIHEDAYEKLQASYGTVDINTIIEATIKSEIAMGYTNPYASSTGINFLLCALQNFDSTDILSDNAISKFQQFQQNVPFVAYSTLQMRDAADNGVLDAFVLEYQCYSNIPELHDYQFIPFGVRHDNPVYSIGTLSPDQEQLLNAFIDFCKSEPAQRAAKKYGFNYIEDYSSTISPDITGAQMLSAQHLWKTEKDSGAPVLAVFVADVSGSMAGAPITNLQTSLINASQYINSSNYIGLVSYSTDVTINLPIAQFDLNQRSYFTGAVEDLSPGGNTATYDAVLVALNMLMTEQEKIEASTGQKVKPLLFVLSDGETNIGNNLSDIDDIVSGFEVPCYTIGYNADLKKLAELSEINEAASINADSDDVVYNLKSLFNAQM